MHRAKPPTPLQFYDAVRLEYHFQRSGLVLQDLVNEVGRRLEYQVTNGRYQGTTNTIGYDGIWVSPEGYGIVIEVKTTDAYRISLDKIARYREELIKAGQIGPDSSVLIVVGREDTGELEAQVRGSRYAWDMRLISTDALIKLLQLKEQAEGPDTGKKIRSLLTPREYTRLDEMVDVMFTTAKDVEQAISSETLKEEEPPESELDNIDNIAVKQKGIWQFTDSSLLQEKRDVIVSALAKRENIALIKKSRALYWSPSHDLRAAITISKRYLKKGDAAYWYAYHPAWREFLSECERGHIVLGCMDRNNAFVIPTHNFHSLLEYLNTTEKEDHGSYWHLHIHEEDNGELSLLV